MLDRPRSHAAVPQLGPSDMTVLVGDKRRYVALIAHTR